MPKGFSDIKNEDDIINQLLMMIYVITLNVSYDDDYDPNKIGLFSDKDVVHDFNGDKGFYSFSESRSNFSKGYNYVSINMIYKKNIGVVVVYVLINDVNNYLERSAIKENQEAYYCVKFN